MTIPPGHRFEATQALRQVLARAVAWGMLDVNPAKQGVDNPQRRRTEKRPFESWESSTSAAARPRAAMVLFAAATASAGEWIALEYRDIDRGRAGRLRAPLVQKRAGQVHEDRGAACAPCRSRRSRSPRSSYYQSARTTDLLFPSGARRLLRPAQLPHPRLEARPARGRDRAAAAGLRSPSHLRHLRSSCRHLHLRPLPLHGRQPDHDRPPLRPPRPRRPRARDRPPRHLHRLRRCRRPRGGRCVDTAASKSSPTRKTTTAAEQAKTGSPLTDSNRRPPPYHGGALPTELRGRDGQCIRAARFRPIWAIHAALAAGRLRSTKEDGRCSEVDA